MYLPPHFQDMSTDEMARAIADAPLACIVAQTDDGLLANHIPVLAGPDGVLIGHVARANDMHRVLADGHEVLAVFRTADGYVSPNSYPSKAEHHRHVPTWNYQVVHVHGTISFQHDLPARRAAVALLTRLHERRVNGDRAWRMADAPADFLDQMLDAIVAFRIQPRRIIGKAKLSQNRSAADRNGAIAGLRASGRAELAALMERRAADDPARG